jgi:uncharacterized protein YjbI with pentapeptide repeats
VLSQTEGPHGPRAKQARYRDHSLASLIYYDTSIVLSTDGPAVMVTTLSMEYGRAYQIIEAVLAGEQPIRVSEADASLDGQIRGIPVADGPGQRELTRAYLEEKAAYLTDYLERMYALAESAEAAKAATKGVSGVEPRRRLPIPAFSLASLKLHEQWVLHGEVGENQQLIAHAADATEMKLSARNLSKAEMDKVTLDRADLSYATLDGARLVDVSFRGASLENASAYEASFVGCHFEGLDAFLFKLRATRFERCDFTGANLMRSVWTRCAITNSAFTGADLRNARLDEAVFTDCDLRDADLSVPEPGVNTARGARFVRCDLRGSKWDGRDLDGVEFADCQQAPGTATSPR